jgi:DNA-binding GntR family transcriptional regulator
VIFIQDYITPALETADLRWDAFDGNMIQFLSVSFDITLHHIQSYIRASAIGPEFLQFLELPEGTPILSVRSTIFSRENRPIAYSKIYFNSNIFELNIVRMIQKKDHSI